ncbi:hypothetical protein OAT18_01250 [Tenacibaculum sp.]|nr:hypothetical protein [Tenacibaculum sp.]
MDILIINSKNHWVNGWAKEPEKLDIIIKILEKSGFTVRSVEVEELEQLQNILNETSQDTLVWINAYWINIGGSKVDWLNAYVEKHNLPLVGQSQKTLENLLRKDLCQSMLENTNIPIPSHIVIYKDQITEIASIIGSSLLTFPIVVKPTNESRSSGVRIVHNITEVSKYIKLIFEQYPEGNIIVEEFLPMDDVTCGYIELNGEVLLLPSYNLVEGMNCKEEIFGEDHYLLPVSAIQQPCVKDESILTQFKKHVPAIVKLFGIKGITRVDGRANKKGELNFFDINGMPGLNFPESAIIKQCYNHFPKYSKEYVFECLINTIILDKLIEYNFTIPKKVNDNNLFVLESSTVLKLEAEVAIHDYR